MRKVNAMAIAEKNAGTLFSVSNLSKAGVCSWGMDGYIKIVIDNITKAGAIIKVKYFMGFR